MDNEEMMELFKKESDRAFKMTNNQLENELISINILTFPIKYIGSFYNDDELNIMELTKNKEYLLKLGKDSINMCSKLYIFSDLPLYKLNYYDIKKWLLHPDKELSFMINKVIHTIKFISKYEYDDFIEKFIITLALIDELNKRISEDV